MTSTDKKVRITAKIYTDGACSGNPGAGGWGSLLLITSEKGKEPISLRGGEKSTTNNRMEMTAVIESLKFLLRNMKDVTFKIDIVSDSAYIVDNVNEGSLKKWSHNGWKTTKGGPVKNKDLWEELLSLIKNNDFEKITFIKVKGHSGDKFNDHVDKIAVTERDRFKGILNNVI